jgi:hypothetical protein
LEGEKNTDWIFYYSNYLKAKKLKDDMDSMKQQISRVDRRRFNMSKEDKRRLRVSNIYDHNASMKLDKEREAKRLARVYEETNKECEK